MRVGTSGWVYRHWRGGFYLPATPQKRWLAFDTAKINATFYRLPSQAAVAGWRKETLSDSIFAWKASRF